MVTFSQDIDLIKWEPVLFQHLALSSQQLCEGTDGILSSTDFSSATADFTAAGIASGHIICVGDDARAMDLCYEVVSVDSPTSLTVSVIRSTAEMASVAPEAGESLAYRVRTFDPQADVIARELLAYFGVADGDVESSAISIINASILRHTSVFGVLAAVFSGAAIGEADPNGYWEKSLRYQERFKASRNRGRLEIDFDGDARVDEIRAGGTIRLQRG